MRGGNDPAIAPAHDRINSPDSGNGVAARGHLDALGARTNDAEDVFHTRNCTNLTDQITSNRPSGIMIRLTGQQSIRHADHNYP